MYYDDKKEPYYEVDPDLSDKLEDIKKIEDTKLYLPSKEAYCGNHYGDKKLRCPIHLVTKKYVYDNRLSLDDIPKDLFHKDTSTIDPVDKFLDTLIEPVNFGNKLSKIDNANNLNNAFHNYSKGGLLAKESVQRYRANQLRNELSIKQSIESSKYSPSSPHEFILTERGHTRYIKSSAVKDQVIQRSLNDNLLIPAVRKNIIYNNCASLKDKGLSLQRKRFKIDLLNAYKEYNGDAYILFIDFSKYFDNIVHSLALNMFGELLTPYELEFLKICFKEFEINVSYMEDDEYELAMNTIFNSITYNEYINSNNINLDSYDNKKVLKKSMGIGNQISQVTGVYYPHIIDNYVTKVRGIKYYGRYMDDSYVIMKSKEELKDLLSNISSKATSLKIFINFKKTYISKLSTWNTFLKIRYFIRPHDLRVIEKPVKETFIRERRRLKKFYKLLNLGRIDIQDIIKCYKSWKGSYKKYDCNTELFKLDKLFASLFDILPL